MASHKNGTQESDEVPASRLKRDTTMVATTREAVAYLRESGGEKLVKFHGLQDPEPQQRVEINAEKSSDGGEDVPKLARDTTMIVTAREGEQFVSGSLDTDARTRGQQQKITDLSNQDDEPQAKKVKLQRDNTMVTTAKLGEEFLNRNPCACGPGTEQHTHDLEPEKPTKTQRTSTMDATALEGVKLLEGQVLAGSRSATVSANVVDSKPASLGRATTMQVTAAEGAALLDGKELGGTRSATEVVQQSSCATDDEPKNLKRTHTMAETVAEGEEFVHRHDNQ